MDLNKLLKMKLFFRIYNPVYLFLQRDQSFGLGILLMIPDNGKWLLDEKFRSALIFFFDINNLLH